MGNTDTLIIVVAQPKKKGYTILHSCDTMVDMVGDDSGDVAKINSAYARGGAKMTMQTVSTCLTPAKYHALADGRMEAGQLRGRIYVTPPLGLTYSGFFQKGSQAALEWASGPHAPMLRRP